MIIVSGKLQVESGSRAAYLEGCRKIVESARNAPGCLDFALSADLLEPDRINVYERWESEQDVARFRGAGPEPEQEARIRGAEVVQYRVRATETL